MLNIYQNNSINDANKPKDAATYWSSLYLCTILEVWYNIDPEAKTTIPTLNHKPKLKPNNTPATINPKAIKNPIAKIDFKKEKSFFVKSTIAESPENKDKVRIAAWLRISAPPSSAVIIAMNINGIKIKASAIT